MSGKKCAVGVKKMSIGKYKEGAADIKLKKPSMATKSDSPVPPTVAKIEIKKPSVFNSEPSHDTRAIVNVPEKNKDAWAAGRVKKMQAEGTYSSPMDKNDLDAKNHLETRKRNSYQKLGVYTPEEKAALAKAPSGASKLPDFVPEKDASKNTAGIGNDYDSPVKTVAKVSTPKMNFKANTVKTDSSAVASVAKSKPAIVTKKAVVTPTREAQPDMDSLAYKSTSIESKPSVNSTPSSVNGYRAPQEDMEALEPKGLKDETSEYKAPESVEPTKIKKMNFISRAIQDHKINKDIKAEQASAYKPNEAMEKIESKSPVAAPPTVAAMKVEKPVRDKPIGWNDSGEKEMVAAYQKRHGLKADGVWGKDTKAYYDKSLKGGSSKKMAVGKNGTVAKTTTTSNNGEYVKAPTSTTTANPTANPATSSPGNPAYKQPQSEFKDVDSFRDEVKNGGQYRAPFVGGFHYKGTTGPEQPKKSFDYPIGNRLKVEPTVTKKATVTQNKPREARYQRGDNYLNTNVPESSYVEKGVVKKAKVIDSNMIYPNDRVMTGRTSKSFPKMMDYTKAHVEDANTRYKKNPKKRGS